MRIPDKLKEYIWLLNTIRRHKKITLKEINELWVNTEMSGGCELARTSFVRHLAAIGDIFGIIIDCDRHDGHKYFIENESVLREDTVQNWMLSTMSVNNIISESMMLQDRILLEQVSCDDYLPMVLDAMKKKVRIAVKYRRYGTNEPKCLDFEPYCVKLFKQRWYVLGHFHRDATEEKPERDYFGVFAFDRILDIELTDVKFEVRSDFDAKHYFSDCYGVVVGDGTELQRIVIRAFGVERFYLRDLPMHPSQREIGQGEDYADFEMFLRPTLDFKGHILNRGAQVMVLEPKTLADDIKQMLNDALSRYEQ